LRPATTRTCAAGEILGLTWENVNLLDAIIRLDSGTTKNDEPRVIPLFGELLEILKMQRTKRDADCPECRFVFFHCGNRVLDFRKSWEISCATAGLGAFADEKNREDYTGLLFHDLRRSGVRNMVRAGIPQRVAMQISGHKTFEIFQRYNITSERDLRDAARKLDAYLTSRNGAKTGITEVQTDSDADVKPAVTQ
jgi:integrase